MQRICHRLTFAGMQASTFAVVQETGVVFVTAAAAAATGGGGGGGGGRQNERLVMSSMAGCQAVQSCGQLVQHEHLLRPPVVTRVSFLESYDSPATPRQRYLARSYRSTRRLVMKTPEMEKKKN